MIYLTHGYIDIFNHEIQRDDNKRIKLVTNSEDIIFQNNEESKYNSKEFVSKVFQKVLDNLNNTGVTYKKIQIKKSGLKLLPKNQIHSNDKYAEHRLTLSLHPSEDTAHVFIDELNIIAAFNNEIICTKQEYLRKKNIILEESTCQLITIPEHCIQIALNHCSNYNKFKNILVNSIYEDVHSYMVSELKKTNLSKWDIDLGKTNLDIESIVNDNLKILVA